MPNAKKDWRQLQVTLLVCLAAAMILAGVTFIAAHFLGNESEKPLQQQEIKHEEVESASSIQVLSGGDNPFLRPVAGIQQTWPDVKGEPHCLLVRVEPPLSVPSELNHRNTLRVPIAYCLGFIRFLIYEAEEGKLSREDVEFKPPEKT